MTTGLPVACPSYPIKSVQITGTFGGATCTIQGSNMVTTPTYFSLEDIQGNAIALTSDGGQPIAINTYWVRPILSSISTATNVDVYMLCVTER